MKYFCRPICKRDLSKKIKSENFDKTNGCYLRIFPLCLYCKKCLARDHLHTLCDNFSYFQNELYFADYLDTLYF